MFLTRANAGQAERLLGALGRLQVDQMAWEPATYYPAPRGRRNEHLRPQLSELLPLADLIRQLSGFHGAAWANLEAHTEAAWVARALAGDWPPQLAGAEPAHGDQGLPLVCRPSLELHTGVAGRYHERHGNLRADGAQAVLNRALEPGGRSAVWLDPTGCRPLRSWPPSMATEQGRECTSPRRRSATCGWTGPSDAPPPSSTRGRGMSERL
ncbi:MAG TPA: hypothetical protein VHA34_13705, partial [Actinomycetes bacterium]|nr:hypothetical protein [Actinomycetes bacterium]